MELGIILTALGFGLVTSLHCAGMCGPIAIALPLKKESALSRIIGIVLYGLGKGITYGIIGLLLGAFGQGLALGGFQRWLSIIMGGVMIISVFFPRLFKNPLSGEKKYGFTQKISNVLGVLFRNSSHGAMFLIGLLNGLLPCGPVYAAAAGALATGEIITGALFMFVFGLGTMPMLAAIAFVGNKIGTELRKKLAKAVPVTIVLLGMLFVLRGLSLGIPFISPPDQKLHVPQQKETTMPQKHSCH